VGQSSKPANSFQKPILKNPITKNWVSSSPTTPSKNRKSTSVESLVFIYEPQYTCSVRTV
jgi:hypothetical protein